MYKKAILAGFRVAQHLQNTKQKQAKQNRSRKKCYKEGVGWDEKGIQDKSALGLRREKIAESGNRKVSITLKEDSMLQYFVAESYY